MTSPKNVHRTRRRRRGRSLGACISVDNCRLFMARRKLMRQRLVVWGTEIAVDWAEPEQVIDEDVMAKVKRENSLRFSCLRDPNSFATPTRRAVFLFVSAVVRGDTSLSPCRSLSFASISFPLLYFSSTLSAATRGCALGVPGRTTHC